MAKTKEEIAKQKHNQYLKYKASGRTKIYQKTNRIKHREKRIAYTIEWRKRNPDKIKATEKKRLEDGRAYKSSKKYREANPNKIKVWNKKTYWKHREKRLADHKIYYQKNKDKIKINAKAYAKTPAGKIAGKRSRIKTRSTPHGHLRHAISNGVRTKLLNHNGKKYRASIDKILPFKIPELIARLESMFKPGMTWDNYGKWHVDHIIADSSFNYTTINCPSFKQAWALTNLQPLWANENCSKGNKTL